MKKALLVSIVLIIVLSIEAFADETGVVITERDRKTESVSRPRMPSIIPISCYFDADLGYVGMIFSYDFGEVVIQLENTYTEASITVTTETVYGSILIPFSAEPGLYQITIFTTLETDYVGRFEL